MSRLGAAVSKNTVIDEQQRLTTISLLLLALADYSREYYEDQETYQKCETYYEKIKNLYLVNQYAEDNLYYKLKLCDDDFRVYKHLIAEENPEGGRTLPEDIPSNLVYSNYQYLRMALTREKLSPSTIMEGVRKLLLVDIVLKDEDNAQLVFETVNSTGRPLTDIQKIQNYILMTVSYNEQEELYNSCWLPMKKQLENDFDAFLKYYLTAHLEKQTYGGYYDTFKGFIRLSGKTTKEVVENIKKFSGYYDKWKNAGRSKDSLDVKIADIKETGQWTFAPVILRILDDLNSQKCTYTQAIDVLSIMESYITRRMLLDLPTKTGNKVCIAMLKALDKGDYVGGFVNCIYSLTWAQRMPSDEELYVSLKTVPLYRNNPKGSRRILDRMESYINKDYSHNSNHSIEHIMPQTIESEEDLYARTDLTAKEKEERDWAGDLGADWKTVHDTYCNTIGNLTLTGYNPNYQNCRFLVKRDKQDKENGICYGYKQTCIHLSASLATKEKWGEEEILERAKEMTDIIISIWQGCPCVIGCG